MKNSIAPNTIAIATPKPAFDKMSKRWALVVVALGLTVGVALDVYTPPISCERHGGAFSSGFSADFDIRRLECRANWMTRSPTLNLYGVSPYVSVTWPD